MDLTVTSWDYEHGSDLATPLSSIEKWIDSSIANSSISWLDCLMLDVRRPLFHRRHAARVEAFSPGRSDRMAWLRVALTGSHKLLLILGHQPDIFLHAFTKAQEMPDGFAQLRVLPWEIPEEACPGLIASFQRAGGGTIIGHDGQFLLTARPTDHC